MPKIRDTPAITESEEPLVDKTASLSLHSKRTNRQQKKRHLKASTSKQNATLWDLPSEILLQILSYVKPSTILNLSQTSKSFHSFIQHEAQAIATGITAFRYPILSRCFPSPVLLSHVPKETHPALLDEERQIKHLHIHKKPYQHIQPPNPHLICTCLTCILAWNNLCVILDFAFWQGNLQRGEPIPMIPRGKSPKWNTNLILTHSNLVLKALHNPIFYIRILETHLYSTVTSIERHANNKGNRRRRFRMEKDDVLAGTDEFLKRSGPPTLDFPFHREDYYMLEAYSPNRGWNEESGTWRYMPKEQHERDVEFVRAWKGRRDEERGRKSG